MASADLERRFHHAMLSLYEVWRDACGYRAIYFGRMVRNRGGLEAARRLLKKAGVSQGFQALHKLGKLHLTMEAMIVESAEWRSLFTEAELQVARERLREHGYQEEGML
jgi:hypothetical protein